MKFDKLINLGIFSLAIYALVLGGATAYSQSDGASFQFFILDDIYIGGRAVGMGGASMTVGGDLASTERNPANMIMLPRSIIEFDLSYSSFQRKIYEAEYSFSNTTPSYIGAALNYGSLAFGFYQHKLYNINEKYKIDGFNLPINVKTPDLDLNRNFEITFRGFEVAILLTEDVAFGIGFKRGDLKFKSASYREAIIENPYYDLTNSRIEVSDDDSAWSFGLLFSPRQRFSFAISYTLRLSYSIKELQSYMLSSEVVKSEMKEYKLNIPRRFNLGFGYNFGKVRIALDFQNKYYSDLLDDGMEFGELNLSKEAFSIKNIKEYHFGIEIPITFAKGYVLSLRGGAQYVPFHAIEYVGSTGDIVLDSVLEAMYPEGDGEFSASFGSGINFKQAAFIDAGFMFSSVRKSIIINGGVCF
jgi:hypothetical protein